MQVGCADHQLHDLDEGDAWRSTELIVKAAGSDKELLLRNQTTEPKQRPIGAPFEEFDLDRRAAAVRTLRMRESEDSTHLRRNPQVRQADPSIHTLRSRPLLSDGTHAKAFRQHWPYPPENRHGLVHKTCLKNAVRCTSMLFWGLLQAHAPENLPCHFECVYMHKNMCI